MKKLDLRREFKPLLSPSAKEVSLVRVPAFNFLMIDGHGNPNDNPLFMEAMQALYTLSYGLKFGIKKLKGIAYPVMPLEGLWWAEDMQVFTMDLRRDWLWTVMILQPKPVTRSLVEAEREQALAKGKTRAIERVRFETFREGLSVQIMHLGPYAAEGPTIARMHAYMDEHGLDFNGKHHEIYLGDPRRAAPAKLKTVLRQPVKKKS